MTDIFAKENIQTSSINPIPAAATEITAGGAPVSSPTGEAGGDIEMPEAPPAPKMDDAGGSALPPDTSTPRDFSSSAPAPAMPLPPENGDVGSVPVPEGHRDIFAAEGLQAESIDQKNSNALNSGLDISNPQTPEQSQAKTYLEHEMSNTQILAQARFTPEQIADFKNNPITFGEAFKHLDANQVLPGGGLFRAAEAGELVNIVNKLKGGQIMKDLSVGEAALLDKYVNHQLEMNLRGFSIRGKIAYVGSQIPAFVTEFIATGGFGKAAEEAVVASAGKLATNYAVKATGGMARVAAQTSLMLPQYAARYGELRINDAMAITDKGQLIAKQSTEAPATSALKAFGYTAADVAGQIAAPVVGKYVLNPVTKAVKTPLIAGVNALPSAVKTAMFDAYKVVEPTAQMSKVFTAAGWHSMLEQLGANRVSEVLHASVNLAADKDYTFDDYLDEITPSKDQLLVEGGLIAIAGGIHTAGDVTVNLLKSKGMPDAQARETVDNMTANEKEQYVENNLPMPKSVFPKATAADGKPVMADEAVSTVNEDTVHSHPEAEVIASQINSQEKAAPPPIIDEESTFNTVYRAMWNGLEPIHKLPEMARERGAKFSPVEDSKLLSTIYAQNVETIRQNLQVATSVFDTDGNRVITGKALKSTMDDFDNVFIAKEPSQKQRKQDFSDYLRAQRYLLDLQDNPNVEVSADKIQESTANLKRLMDKYGDDYGLIEPLAREVYSFQGRILDNLVSSGVMSKELREQLAKDHPHYVPLQKIIDENFPEAVSSKGQFTDARLSKVIKRIKGSDLEDKDVFESIIKNTAKILDLSARNNVAKSVANYAPFLPEYIQKTSPAIVKKGTAEVKVSYDPKLRAKLEAAIKLFGHEVERSKSVRVKGAKNVLGSYSPMEKLVRLKLGTTEGTLAHEVGHMLDYQLGLKKRMLSNSTVKAELQKLAEDRLFGDIKLVRGEEGLRFKEELKGTEGTKKYRDYIKNDDEILANFFDAYVNSPEQLDAIAPTARGVFEGIIDANPDIAFLRDIKPSTSRTEEAISKDVYGEADYAPPNTITVFRDGEKEYYTVSKPILEAMTQLSPMKINIVEKFLAAPVKFSSNLLRAGATMTPEFVVRNILRDQHDAFLQSGVGYNPVHFAKGLFAALGHTDLYNQWAASGGKYNSYMALDDAGIQKAYKELFRPKGRLARYLTNPLNILKDASQAGEHATRIGVFDAAKGKGLSDIEAAVQSLEATINFTRKGSVGGRINQYIPFFNAGLQASDKLIRTFKENPAALTFWGLATITVPSMLITGYYLYEADDKTRKAYLEIPQWQRDIAWIVFDKEGNPIAYPKPFTYGYIFGSVPERIMLWGYDGNKPQMQAAWKDIVKGMAGSVSPVNDWSAVIPPLFKVAFEDVANYNFFTGRPIYPTWMNSLTPEKRAGKYTSESAKLLGEKIGMSPAIIEHTIQGTIGSSGKYVTDAGDQILKAAKEWNGESVPEKPVTAADLPLIKAFFKRRPSGYRSNSVQEFMSNFTRIEQEHAVYNDLDGKEQAEYLQENRNDLAHYSELQSAQKEMRGVQKQIDAIYDHKTMSAEDKVEKIQHLEDQITEIARNANIKYRKSRGEN